MFKFLQQKIRRKVFANKKMLKNTGFPCKAGQSLQSIKLQEIERI